MQSSPGISNLHDDQLYHDPVVLEEIYLPEILHVGPTTQDVATQTELPETSCTKNSEVYRKPKVTTCDVECQFPYDIMEEALSDHT